MVTVKDSRFFPFMITDQDRCVSSSKGLARGETEPSVLVTLTYRERGGGCKALLVCYGSEYVNGLSWGELDRRLREHWLLCTDANHETVIR
jgi:hypothetical protein